MTHWLGAIALASSLFTGVGMARAEDEAGFRAQLEAVRTRRILFAHQSVGMNVVDGLESLSRQAGAPLPLRELRAPSPLPAGTVSHLFVGANGDPSGKLRHFAEVVDGLPRGEPDVAMVKLCFADVNAATDARALFTRYQAVLTELQARHPGTVFVHVTVPLTTVQGGPKALVKRLLGRPPGGLADNARREEYNALLRQAYQGKAPIYDLARVESTRPDGSTVATTLDGRSVPALAPELTDDGGHLNADGRRRAARELVAVLAALPGPGRTEGAR